MTWQSFRKRAMEISELGIHVSVSALLLSLAFFIICVGLWLIH